MVGTASPDPEEAPTAAVFQNLTVPRLVDPDLQAILFCVKALAQLPTDDERRLVVRYLAGRFGTE